MLFWAKKFISFWLMPFNVCLTLLVAAWILGRSPRSSRPARTVFTAGMLALLFFSNKWVASRLEGPLETMYPPVPEFHDGEALPAALARCRYIAVLGAGHSDSAGLPATSMLSPGALARLAEAIRLSQVLPDATVLVSGPGVGSYPTHASVLARAAASLGVNPSRIRMIDTARDTEEESLAVKRIAGNAPVALVTSAWHMPRAAALFRTAQVDFLPCPVDYQVRPHTDFRLGDLLWDAEALDRSTWAIRERIGYLWIWLRGKASR